MSILSSATSLVSEGLVITLRFASVLITLAPGLCIAISTGISSLDCLLCSLKTFPPLRAPTHLPPGINFAQSTTLFLPALRYKVARELRNERFSEMTDVK